MRIAYLYSGGRLRRLQKVREKAVPSEFFYGAEELRVAGHDVSIFEIAENARPGLLARGIHLTRAHLPLKVTGLLLQETHRLAKAISESDVLIAGGSGEAFAAEIWRQAGAIRCPVVGIHCGILNVKYPPIRKWTTRSLLARTWTLLFGDGEFEPLLQSFSIPPTRVMVNQYGIDVDFWTPANDAHAGYVLAIGNDGRRDYDLLMKVAAQSERNFVVVTRNRFETPIPPNVKLVRGDFREEILTDSELRDLYRGAACIVTPLIESFQPSGQSVCLQAMACARPVILTQTAGLWSKDLLKDGENILLTEAGDVAGVSRAIDRIFSDNASAARIAEAGRATVLQHWTTALYANRLEAFIQNRVLASDATCNHAAQRSLEST